MMTASGEDEDCHYCGRAVGYLLSDPSVWPVRLPLGPDGKFRAAHVGCVMMRLRRKKK